jgi:hypothetical protein
MMIEILRAVVRPFLAISCWAATIAFLAAGMDVPEAWWALVAAVSTFYFVQRHEEKKAGTA